MSNRLRARLEAGRACVNGWSTLPCPFTAQIMAQSGWDSVTIDMQHGLHDYASAAACFQAMQAHPVTPLVRVPWNEPGIIGKVLDAGAWGVICPMVNTAADAEALAKACLYPPDGERSYGPLRAAGYGGTSDYHGLANREVLVLPQIETRQSVEHIAEILDVPGISGIYVGPSDLGLSLGLAPSMDREEPEILETYAILLGETSRRGLIAGIQTSAASYAAKMIGLGFRLVTTGTDIGFVARGARSAVTHTRIEAGVVAST